MHRPHHTRLARRRATRLRNNLTISEARLWSRLRRRQVGVRFRRQAPIGVWIADFVCLNPKLVVEVDGPSHDFGDESRRTEGIRQAGFTVLRFTNKDVASRLDEVVSTIQITIAELQDS